MTVIGEFKSRFNKEMRVHSTPLHPRRCSFDKGSHLLCCCNVYLGSFALATYTGEFGITVSQVICRKIIV